MPGLGNTPFTTLQLLEASPDPTTEVLVLRLLVQLVSFPQLKAAALRYGSAACFVTSGLPGHPFA